VALLRGNLATRPFYNERLVSLGLVLGFVGVLALTAFNITEVLSRSRERAAVKQEQERDDRDAAAVLAATASVQKSVDRVRLTGLARQTREANSLIDERTFSWTVFFGYIEQTMPLDARLISVAPRIERGEFLIAMSVNARRSADLEDFIDQLWATGVFYDVAVTSSQRNDDGTFTGAILSRYYLAPKPASATRAVRGR